MLFLSPEQLNGSQIFSSSSGSGVVVGSVLDTMSTIACALLGVISAIAVIGNMFVFWAVIVDKRLRTPSNLFILSLALSDLLLAMISIPVYIILHITNENVLGEGLCKTVAFIDNTLVIISCWTLVLTSVDRFVLILFSPFYKKIICWSHSFVMISAVWIYAIIIAVLPFFGWNSYGYGDNNCHIEHSDHPYYPTFFFLTFPVPIIITCVCYIGIFYKTCQIHSRFKPGTRSLGRDKVTRVTIMVLVLVIAHVILTLPAFVMNLIYYFSPRLIQEHVTPYMLHLVIIMFFANAAVNPFLYGIFNTNFQKTFRFCPCVSNQPDILSDFNDHRRVTSANNSMNSFNVANMKSVMSQNNSTNSQADVIFFNKNFLAPQTEDIVPDNSPMQNGDQLKQIERHTAV